MASQKHQRHQRHKMTNNNMKYRILHMERGKQSMLGLFLGDNYFFAQLAAALPGRAVGGRWVAGG